MHANFAAVFSVIMNETTDLAHLKQTAVVVRYCDESFKASERPIAVVESPVVTGEHLAEVLLNSLERFHLDTHTHTHTNCARRPMTVLHP